jgi:FAD/FMN-containing dehydrogenase
MPLTGTDPIHSAIDDLAQRFSGELITPRDAAYDQARRVWNAAIDRRPAVIVRPRYPLDISEALRYARAHQLPVAVRGGGHSLAGHGTIDGGLVIDQSLMRHITIDADSRIGTAESGATWGEYTTRAHASHLITPAGDTSTVGVAGLTLGGGIGLLARPFGLTIDHLIAVELITADGSAISASEDEHADLFWAMRGAGWNFGVATRFLFQLRPLSTILGGALFYPLTRAVVRDYIDRALAAPDELTTMAFAMKAPPLPFLPAEVRGTLVLFVIACHTGDIDAAPRAMAPLRMLGKTTPIADTIAPTTYPALWDLTAEGAKSRPHAFRGGFMRTVNDDAIEIMEAHLRRVTSPRAVVQLRVLGGAMARVPADATAFAHRDKPVLLEIITPWEEMPGVSGRDHIAWTEALWKDLASKMDGAYANFLGQQELGEARVREAYPPATYARLAEIKRRYDPENVFRQNINIPPA